MHGSSLAGKVVVVVGGGAEPGRSVGLAVAARGARVVLLGAEERALGEVVGEIAFGGGKARHVVGAGAAGVRTAVARAREVFGAVDCVVVCAGAVDEGLLEAAESVAVVAVGVPAPGEGVRRVDYAEGMAAERAGDAVVFLWSSEVFPPSVGGTG